MGYKNLRNFKNIIDSDDFNFISDVDNINKICNIILYNVPHSSDSDSDYAVLVRKFLDEMQSFCEWVNMNEIPDIKKAYSKCEEVLLRVEKFLRFEDPEKRKSISKGYLRKFKRSFLYGLSTLLAGIRVAFHSDLVVHTNIQRIQIINFIVDKVEGMSGRFVMNKAKGKFNFINHLPDLTREELIKTLFTLEHRIPSTHPKIGEWKIMGSGSGANDIRIHYIDRFFGKTRLYRIYRVNGEHSNHEAHAQKLKVSQCYFDAA